MKLVILFITCLSTSAFGQKIVYDKKDPFTGKRSLATDQQAIFGNGLGKIADVSGALIAGDSSSIVLAFSSKTFGIAMETSTADSIRKECLLKTSTGKIIYGKWGSTTDAAGLTSGPFKISSFQFSKSDLITLSKEAVTDIKFIGDKSHGLQFEVSKKNQDNISKIAILLLKYL